MQMNVLLTTSLALSTLLLGACAPYGDAAHASRQHRKEVERRTADMRVATNQVTRGADLVGAALVEALTGRTMVQRYASFPDGRRGEFLQYRHFAADGSLQVVDNWLEPSGGEPRGDWWKVEGARICTLHHAFSQTPSCYRVARARDGALQWYVDNPGLEYHGLLTIVAREWLDGPPPAVKSVLVSPLP